VVSLREYRKRVGLTQSELAAQAGIRSATLSALENGRSRPHSGTIHALAKVLGVSEDELRVAVLRSQRVMSDGDGSAGMAVPSGRDWAFLRGLDADLREGLAKSLVAEWTHTSTALEGNTITAGDTLFVLEEGMTVGGKSLREHQELHGHAQALGLMSAWIGARQPVRIESLHELHRVVQTGSVVDSLAPVGKWKVEQNGTMAMTSGGKTEWHEYARASHVPALIDEYLVLLAELLRHPLIKKRIKKGINEGVSVRDPEMGSFLIDAYTDLHLGFTGIHPYADGNGRLARLLANIPVLRAGFPPILISVTQRREYITMMGDYSLKLSQPEPGNGMLRKGLERDALRDFFAREWESTLRTVAEFHARQKRRNHEGS
jgi:transcriptional regulator with XRE-family HTH domain